MKHRIAAAAVLVLLLGVASLAGAVEKPWYAPKLEQLGFFVFDPPFVFQDFKVTTIEGISKTRTSTKGKIVLLNFWATWCPPCREEIPAIESLAKTMSGKNFEVFAVSVGEDAKTVKSFVEEQKITYPIYLDTKNILGRTYASQGIPTTYILDKNGKFIAGIVGSYKYDNPAFLAFLTELSSK